MSFFWRFSWRGIGVIVLSFLVAADLPPQPVIVTEELSFEVVNQIEETSEACRDARETGGSSCATEVWKSCHLADQTLDNFKESPSLGDVQAKMYLCGLAVIADAGDLAKSLASRYGDQYYTSGWFKTVKVDEGNTSFLLFQDLLIVELSTLIKPVNSGTPLADQYFIIRTPISIAIDKYSGYSRMSDDTEKNLLLCDPVSYTLFDHMQVPDRLFMVIFMLQGYARIKTGRQSEGTSGNNRPVQHTTMASRSKVASVLE